MNKIVKYDDTLDLLTIECECENLVDFDFSKIERIEFLEEFGEYENINIFCENCKRIHILNSNIAVSEYEERIYEELFGAYSEINDRKILRDILWKKRTDLKEMDRTAYNNEKKYLYDEVENELKEIKLLNGIVD
jgi:hypothetical protein